MVRTLSPAVIQCLVLLAGMITISSCGHQSATDVTLPGIKSGFVTETQSDNRIRIEDLAIGGGGLGVMRRGGARWPESHPRLRGDRPHPPVS